MEGISSHVFINWFAPTLEESDSTMKKDYDWTEMTLSEICTVLIDHGVPFERQREMKPRDLCASIEMINAGELKSLVQLKAERDRRAEERKGRR